MSTSYHPQSDGQTEVVNKVVQQYLRCFCHDRPHEWGKFLHWAEWNYNTATHTSTGFSPFEVVYGKPPPSLPQYVLGSSSVEALDLDLSTRDRILSTLKNKLLKAQDTMKRYADKKRIPHNFQLGDLVLVKLKPFRQHSVAGHCIHKLSKRFFGPFKLVRQIGEVAFEVELPSHSKINPVFHVSQLKPYHGSELPIRELPPDAIDNQPVLQPLAVLDWKISNDPAQSKVLIQWDHSFPEDATWEPFHEIASAFPNLHLKDKVTLDG